MKNRIYILICFCCLTGLCHGQNKKVDSLLRVLKTAKEDTAKVNTLNTLANEFRNNNPDTAKYFASQAQALAGKLSYRIGLANAWLIIGIASTNLGNYEMALKNTNDAIKLYDQLLSSAIGVERSAGKSKILKQKAKANSNIGNVFVHQGNYPEALKNLSASLKIREEIGDKAGIAISYNTIGSIYRLQSKYTEALKNLLASLKIREEIGDKYNIAITNNNIGLVYSDQGNYPEALKNYPASLKVAEEIGDKQGIARTSTNIGLVYQGQGNYPEALKNFFAALKIQEGIGEKQDIARTYNYIGNVFRNQKKNNEASQYLNLALALAKEIGSLRDISDSYLGLATLDSVKDNFKQSLEHYKLYVITRDSIYNKENTEKLVQSKMQYEFDKKESLAKAEQEEKDTLALKELQRQKLLRNFFIGMIGLLLVLSFFVYRTYRTRQLLRLHDIRNKIAGDLHDDIGSTLNSISIYSEVAKKKDENHDEALEMIGDASRKVIDAMSDIVWTINTENDSFAKIIFRMKSLAYNLFRAKNIEFTFHADEVLNEKKLSLEERRNFYLIFKEAVNNLVKYSNATRAAITLTNENNWIRLRIQDDGVGFDTSQENTGNGLKNMKRRADEMNGKFKLESTPDCGTQIELILKG